MTLRECYESLRGDYDGLVERVMGEEQAERFAMMFPADPSYRQLVDALEQGEFLDAFAAAHTLKGICANLGLTRLQELSSGLTEQLRGGKSPQNMEIMEQVAAEYDRTCSALSNFKG